MPSIVSTESYAPVGLPENSALSSHELCWSRPWPVALLPHCTPRERSGEPQASSQIPFLHVNLLINLASLSRAEERSVPSDVCRGLADVPTANLVGSHCLLMSGHRGTVGVSVAPHVRHLGHSQCPAWAQTRGHAWLGRGGYGLQLRHL